MNFEDLDEKDNAIIKMLVEDARLSYSEIGAKIGISRVATKNRVRALEEKGIIKGYHADIDPLATPKNSTFVAVIKTTASTYEEISEMLEKEPCVKTLCKMSGDNQLHAICVANNMEEMRDFAYKVRNHHEGVLSFSAQMVWEIIKGNVLPD
jgi:DNA-binding Lrp family transcriptional regulator